MKNMTTHFDQSHKHPRFYAISILSILIIISYLFTGGLRIVITAVLLMDILFILPYFHRYHISEENVLSAGADVLNLFGKIRIPYIQKLVMQKDRVDIYYLKEGCDVVSIVAYFPADKQLFADTLTSINPDIKVI